MLSCGRATYGRLGRRGVDCNGDEKNSNPGAVGMYVCMHVSVHVCICEVRGMEGWADGEWTAKAMRRTPMQELLVCMYVCVHVCMCEVLEEWIVMAMRSTIVMAMRSTQVPQSRSRWCMCVCMYLCMYACVK